MLKSRSKLLCLALLLAGCATTPPEADRPCNLLARCGPSTGVSGPDGIFIEAGHARVREPDLGRLPSRETDEAKRQAIQELQARAKARCVAPATLGELRTRLNIGPECETTDAGSECVVLQKFQCQ